MKLIPQLAGLLGLCWALTDPLTGAERSVYVVGGTTVGTATIVVSLTDSAGNVVVSCHGTGPETPIGAFAFVGSVRDGTAAFQPVITVKAGEGEHAATGRELAGLLGLVILDALPKGATGKVRRIGMARELGLE